MVILCGLSQLLEAAGQRITAWAAVRNWLLGVHWRGPVVGRRRAAGKPTGAAPQSPLTARRTRIERCNLCLPYRR